MMNKLIVATTAMLLLDGIYLTTVSNMYHEQVATIQRTAMNIKPIGVIACYLFLIVGLYYFILRESRTVFEAFLLGIVIYGVYDSTTYAVFKRWSPILAITDTLWGGILMATTTAITYYVV